MPIYEYRCHQCGATTEFLVGMGSKNQSLSCKQCGSPKLEKMISVSNSSKGEKRQSGHTCCGKEERCSTPPCSTGGSCRRD
jgi:putative FmdB family regulatory protein